MDMATHRAERASGFIQEELTLLLRGAVQDPSVALLTITGVSLTHDRRIARGYVACYSGEEDLREGLKGLERAKGYLRSELSQVLNWRFTPELQFRADRSWQRGARVDELLNALKQDQQGQKSDSNGPESIQDVTSGEEDSG